ncbi:hypothetical protein C0J52_25123 [Blattella germanica]|nr:hypothetical protein C0J52_25123 [Blattella germanica]
MWKEFDTTEGRKMSTSSHSSDTFNLTELTPEQQKMLIDIRRRKTELLLEIQVGKYLLLIL